MSAPKHSASALRRFLAFAALFPLLAACEAQAGADAPGAAGDSAASSESAAAEDGGAAAEFIPADQAAWREVKTWRGSGNRTTEKFQVRGGEFRMIFGATAAEPEYDEAKDMAGNADLSGVGIDTSYVHAPSGIYYLEVSGANNKWAVTVEERALQAERAP